MLCATTPALAATTPVSLTAGRDYAFTAWNISETEKLTLTDPTGAVVALMGNTNADWQQEEFRARYTATYFITIPDDNDGSAFVQLDCAGRLNTQCNIALNHTKHSVYNAHNDVDDWRAKLVAGNTYNVSVSGQVGTFFHTLD